MKIILPWPDKRLSPNARVHWRAKVDPKKDARSDAANATYVALGRGLRDVRASLAGDSPIPVSITFYPPDGRRRDRDNAQASLKHALDGIADALGVDDYRFRPTYAFAEPKKPGRVEVAIYPRNPQGPSLKTPISGPADSGALTGMSPDKTEAA